MLLVVYMLILKWQIQIMFSLTFNLEEPKQRNMFPQQWRGFFRLDWYNIREYFLTLAQTLFWIAQIKAVTITLITLGPVQMYLDIFINSYIFIQFDLLSTCIHIFNIPQWTFNLKTFKKTV